MRPAPKLPLAPGLGWTKDFMRRQSSSRALMGRISCKGGRAHTGRSAEPPPRPSSPVQPCCCSCAPGSPLPGLQPSQPSITHAQGPSVAPTGPQAGIQCLRRISDLTFHLPGVHPAKPERGDPSCPLQTGPSREEPPALYPPPTGPSAFLHPRAGITWWSANSLSSDDSAKQTTDFPRLCPPLLWEPQPLVPRPVPPEHCQIQDLPEPGKGWRAWSTRAWKATCATWGRGPPTAGSLRSSRKARSPHFIGNLLIFKCWQQIPIKRKEHRVATSGVDCCFGGRLG